MIQVKEMDAAGFVTDKANKWLQEHPGVRVIDIKYNVCLSVSDGLSYSSVLIIYEEA